MRLFIKLILLAQLALAGCAYHETARDSAAMNSPMEFESSSEFYRELQTLQGEISDDDYHRLTDAIGYLQAHDLEHLDYEDFHDTLSGLTPNQIIRKADDACSGPDC